MSGGLRYATGRDMPPGMAERVAVQIARRLEEEASVAGKENLLAAVSKVDTGEGDVEKGERENE